MADAAPHSAELLASLGRALARIALALEGFDHPAAHRTLHWDLRQAEQAQAHMGLLDDRQRRLVLPIFEEWSRIDWARLPASVIHADANDYNVLVRDGRVVSILDFGDVVYSATVCDLAVALAYAMLGKADPLAAAEQVTAGYEELRPLSSGERAALYPLAAARLAMSVCYCAWQTRQAPENEYLKISNAPAWELIERLAGMNVGGKVPSAGGRMPAGMPAWQAESLLHELLVRRRRHLGPSLSISYREPLHIVRGEGAYLYDAAGRRVPGLREQRGRMWAIAIRGWCGRRRSRWRGSTPTRATWTRTWWNTSSGWRRRCRSR